MIYRVAVRGRFKAVHALVGDVPAREQRPHPHRYLLEWILVVHTLDSRGFALDIALLEKIKEQQIAEMRRINLNELAYFATINTSLENLCQFLSDALKQKLVAALQRRDCARITETELRVWEHAQAWASITQSFQDGQ